MKIHKKYKKLVVIGTSAGGITAAREIITRLPEGFLAPVVVVQHMNSFMNMFFIDYLNSNSQLKVKEVEHMEEIEPGFVYYIPPNYHALLENGIIYLNSDAKVKYSRPSIDVFFESVAYEEKENVIGVLLSGANNDGSYGLKLIHHYKGITIVQNPETAESKEMPKSAIDLDNPDYILDVEYISKQLVRIVHEIET